MGGRKARIEALPEALLAEPLDFLLAEHARQRALLGHIERLARQSRGATQAAIARVLVAWLDRELPLHLADERLSLVPRLGADAAPAVGALDAEAIPFAAAREALRANLARIAEGHPPAPGFTEQAAAFAAAYRRRMAEEERTLFPLARRDIGPAARRVMAREMAARRR